jgi:hypothetical protein
MAQNITKDEGTSESQHSNNAVLGEVTLCCMDCGRRYDAFGLDVVLSKEQWKLIHPVEQGVLCAQCIVDRADRLGAIRVDLSIAF